jgi:hypothetical protein
MRSLRVWLLGVAVAVLGLVPTASAGVSGWGDLERSLHLPRVTQGGACPISHTDPSVRFASFGVRPGIGSGPAYPLIAHATLTLAPASNFGSRHWAGQKVLWWVRPSYRGPVLIRGARVDGVGRVRFDRGAVPPTEIRIPANAPLSTGGARGRPFYTRVREPGCYAYQVDGTNFSRVVVFIARGGP